MVVLLTSGAVFVAVGVVAGVFTRPWIGLLILTGLGAALAGSVFLVRESSDVYQEMDPKNQALLAAIMFGVPACVGWVAGALIRLGRRQRIAGAR